MMKKKPLLNGSSVKNQFGGIVHPEALFAEWL